MQADYSLFYFAIFVTLVFSVAELFGWGVDQDFHQPFSAHIADRELARR